MNRHLTPGCKTAILINGIPASGKSTITRLLAETFSLAGIDDRRHQRAVYGAPGPCRPADESPAGLRGV